MSTSAATEIASRDWEQNPEEIKLVWQRRSQERRQRRTERANADLQRDRKIRYLLARIGGQTFAFPLANIVAVVPLAAAASPIRLPDAPQGFWGLLALRGEVRPLFEGTFLFQATPEVAPGAAENAHVLLLRPTDAVSSNAANAEEIVGIRVDRAEQVSLFASEEIASPAHGGGNAMAGWTRGVLALPAMTAEQKSDDHPPVAWLVAVNELLAHLRGGDEAEDAAAESSDSLRDQDEEGWKEERT